MTGNQSFISGYAVLQTVEHNAFSSFSANAYKTEMIMNGLLFKG